MSTNINNPSSLISKMHSINLIKDHLYLQIINSSINHKIKTFYSLINSIPTYLNKFGTHNHNLITYIF